LIQWAQYIAKAKLGITPDEVGREKRGTNLSKEELNIRGVLQIEIFAAPLTTRPVVIKKATIAGLSKPARENLTKHRADTKLENLGLPRVVHGAVGEGMFKGRIQIARNEAGEIFNQRQGDFSSDRWLKDKAKKAGAGGEEPTALSRAKTVFLGEIDTKTVKEFPRGIEKP
jgi:hypothetical protein